METKVRNIDKKWAMTGLTLLLVSIMLILSSCGSAPKDIKAQQYQADLKPLNSDVTGYSPEGTANIYIKGDSVVFTVTMAHVPPGIMHLQHLHGFLEDKEALCPTMAQDTTGDSVLDMVEIEQVVGEALIPLNGDPDALNPDAKTFPVADSLGTYSYKATVSMAALKKNLKDKFGIDKPNFEKRVFVIHSIDTSAALPATVQSLPGVPAQVTIPIACGKVVAIKEGAY